MRIIKRVEKVEPVFRITCGSCTSLLEYTKDDIIIDSVDPREKALTYTKCPVCNYNNSHNVIFKV